MIALSTTSMTVIDTVSAARATPSAVARGTPGPQDRRDRQGVAEDEGEGDGQGDRREVRQAQRGADDQPEDLTDGAAGEAVQRCAGSLRPGAP